MNLRWALFWGGILDILFGAALLLYPTGTISVVLLFFGIYAVLQGISLIVGALAGDGTSSNRWWLGLAGIAGLLAGIVALFYREAALTILVYFIIFRAFIIGVAELATSIRLRKEMKGEFLLGLAGIINILFSIYLLLYPATTLAFLILILGWYSIIVGVVLVFRSLTTSSPTPIAD